MSIKSSIFDIEKLSEGKSEDRKEIVRVFLGITGSSSRISEKNNR
ncbi:hypothetical protein [Methanoplanus endosymbiosus]|nr:hypothetical protein [Methanoplanus endosymbiosus]